MLTPFRSLCLCLGVTASFLAAGTAHAQSQTPVPLAVPSLSFSLLSTPVGTTGVSIYQAVLTGFVFSPATLLTLTPSQMDQYSITAFQEKSYELQPGASVLSVQGTTAATPGGNPGDLNWVFSGDARVSSPVMMAIPEDPLPPSDPFMDTFLITVTNPTSPNSVAFSDVPFYYTTVSGLPSGQLIPFVPAVPESSTLALLGLCVTGVLGMAMRRRRA